MKVLCKDNFGYPLSLKIGYVYEICDENEKFFFILDENYEDQYYPKDLFDLLEDFDKIKTSSFYL
jgi:hypothetical protein